VGDPRFVALSNTAQFISRGPQPLTIPPRWLEDDFAAWLQERMEERGISQRMLALRAGVSHSSVSRLLSGDRSPSLPTAIALLRVLAVEPLGVITATVEEAS
jgi:DNA-binding XRE family transcriptional regulator